MYKKPLRVYLKNNIALYTMILPGFLVILIFSYFPIYGIVMAFQDFKPALGFFRSEFVGFKYFQRITTDRHIGVTFKNTVLLGLYSLLINFPAPIILALLFNEIRHDRFKKIAQTISYMPHFLSTVIVVGLMKDMLSTNGGIVNLALDALGKTTIDFFTRSSWFRTLYIGSGLWQGIGFGTIIYLAAIAGVNPELYESAVLDGATRFQQAVRITLPCIKPTVLILFIFAVGGILGNDMQKILLIYSPATYSTSDVISTYVYRHGIEGTSQSYSAAVGLSMSVISLLFLVITNYVCKILGENSLW